MKEYLGDGVYADFDGRCIVLTTETEDGRSVTNTIYLEGTVYEALKAFAGWWPTGDTEA